MYSGWTEGTVAIVEAMSYFQAWRIEVSTSRASKNWVYANCSVKCPYMLLLMPESILAEIGVRRLARVRNTEMKLMVKIIYWFGAEFEKSPIWPNCPLLCIVLNLGVWCADHSESNLDEPFWPLIFFELLEAIQVKKLHFWRSRTWFPRVRQMLENAYKRVKILATSITDLTLIL